jgi:acid phosphatase
MRFPRLFLRRSRLAVCLIGGVGVATLVPGCATRRPTPDALVSAESLRAYVESGRYDQEIAAVAARATAWIDQRAAQRRPAERLAVVFDLDETLFRNWAEIRAANFKYDPTICNHWVHDAKAPAIEAVRETYRGAQRAGVDVILLTGRRAREKPDTLRNLRAIGCADATEVIFMPDAFNGTTAEFKTAERKRIVARGPAIIANIGDQDSDLAGGFAERTFKLPNPFYTTP